MFESCRGFQVWFRVALLHFILLYSLLALKLLVVRNHTSLECVAFPQIPKMPHVAHLERITFPESAFLD